MPGSGVAYGNGQFVAVDDVGTITTSADGTNWVQRQSWPQSIYFDLSRVAYGNGRFVAVGSTIETSADGVSWIERENTLPRESGQQTTALFDTRWVGRLVTAVAFSPTNWSPGTSTGRV